MPLRRTDQPRPEPALARPFHAVQLQERLLDVLERAEAAAKRPRGWPAPRSGFPALDQQLAGERLLVLSGLPLVGKTAMALRFAVESARSGSVLYCSALGEGAALARRLLAQEAGVPLNSIEAGRLSREEWARLTDAASRLGSTPLWLADVRGQAVGELRAAALAHSDAFGLDLLVLDGVRAHSDGVWEALEELASGCQCPVLAVCQSDLSWDTHDDPGSRMVRSPVIVLRADPEQPPLVQAEAVRWLNVAVHRSAGTVLEFRVQLDRGNASIGQVP